MFPSENLDREVYILDCMYSYKKAKLTYINLILSLFLGILKVLDSLSIDLSTIGSISFTDSIAIKKQTLFQDEPTEPSEIPYHMLKNIMLHRHDSRELSQKSVELTNKTDTSESTDDVYGMLCQQEEYNNIHSMDIFLLLFFQCDDLCKQIFIENVAICQNSIPLITNNPIQNKLMIYDFAIGQLKKQCTVNGRVKEFRIVNEVMPFVSFCRFETATRYSKSKMINQIMGVHHNYFFHREISGSSITSNLLQGTVEIGWHLPKQKGNRINQRFAILNLRGNSLSYPIQIRFLQKVSTLIFIYISLKNMNEEEWQYLKEIDATDGHKIVLLIEEKFQVPKYDIRQLKNFQINKNTLILLTENVVTNENKMKDSINTFLEVNPQGCSIKQCNAIAKELGILIQTELIPYYSILSNIVENIFEPFLSHPLNRNESPIAVIKMGVLKLQGEWWSTWANNKRCLHRIQTSDEGIEKQMAKHQLMMKKSRLQQIKHLQTFDQYFLTKLIVYLSNQIEGDQFPYLFLRLVKSYLEDLTLAFMPKLYQCLKEEIEMSNQTNSSDRQRIEKVVKDISESSLGEEHIIRELAQVIEAVACLQTPCDNNLIINMSINYNVTGLPRIGARLLLSGIPLEILDGDVSQIPIIWVKKVFRELHNILSHEKKVYIISILGIQSSGKSTLLNTIFGLQFPVSLGRCTRGAFMQLVPIDQSLSSGLEYDYIMVIDTEGLRGIEQQGCSSHHHDNELATFAIGLANLTIININGENQSDMQDILQITLTALIRMNKVEINPKCIFVHQNVASNNAEEKLMIQRSIFVGLLDDLTVSAAKQEKLAFKFQRFSDVIHFDPESDVFYFPGLWEGEPPMSPVNKCYCEEAEELRKNIFQRILKSPNEFQYLHNMGNRIEEIWSCIMKEDFVFHFRSVLELNLSFELETELAKWESNLTRCLTKWETENLNVLSRLSGNELEEYWQRIQPEISIECHCCCSEEQGSIILKFFEHHKMKRLLKDRRIHVDEYFQSIREKQCYNIKANFQRVYQNYHNNKHVDTLLNKVENQLLQDIRELYNVHKSKTEQGQLTDKMIEDLFLQKWEELSKELPTEIAEYIDIKQEMQSFFHKNHKSIQFSDKVKLIGDIETFDKFGKFDQLFIRKFDHYERIRNKKFPNNKVKARIGKKQENIQEFLQTLQQKCEQLFNSRFPKDSNFSINAFSGMLQLVSNEVKQRNAENQNLNEKARNYTLTIHLIHEFTFFQCCKLLPRFEQLQRDFHDKNSIKNKVEGKKEQFKKYFFSLWKGVQDEQCSANELVTLIFNSISCSANNMMKEEIVKRFNESTWKPSTKYQIQLDILTELCEKENFGTYMKYIKDPFGYTSEWFESRMKDFCSKSENVDTILTKCDEFYNDLIELTINYAGIATDVITSIVTEISDSDEIKRFWKTEFLKLIQPSVSNISNTTLVIFDAYEIENYNTFFQAFRDLLKGKNTNKVVEIPTDFKSLSRGILDGIIQCKVCCPLCNEMCQRNRVRHDHYCNLFHRPLGIVGVKDSQNQLVRDTCPILFKSKRFSTFKFDSSLYPNWNINKVNIQKKNWKIDSKEAIDTRYWIWVLNRFCLQFESEYSASPRPEKNDTQLLTKGDILMSLSDRSDQFGNATYSPETGQHQWNVAKIFLKFFSFVGVKGKNK